MDGVLSGVTAEKERLVDARGIVTVICEALEVVTSRAPEFVDITDEIVSIVEDSGIQFGQATIYSTHTTAAIKINENEPLLLTDLAETLARLAPIDRPYEHNDFSRRTVNMNEEECKNGHAHCQHIFLGTSEAIPIVDSRLTLGQWQRIFLVELDRPRQRRVLVNLVGVAGPSR
jgi:secondary thiamine-phosphate synthase enzyme